MVTGLLGVVLVNVLPAVAEASRGGSEHVQIQPPVKMADHVWELWMTPLNVMLNSVLVSSIYFYQG